MRAKATSCGVIVTDGERLLLGHATRSPRWDIPKGEVEPGESHAAAARRELLEETGLDAPEAALRPLGVQSYRSSKDLALYVWALSPLPDPRTLVCASEFSWNGRMWPEFDRFGLFTHEEALGRVGKNLGLLLAGISLEALYRASN
ncbi:MAG TPA: NUDIX hydrolase [Stellaceae bacterium]|nr:NUDIX hydrolase [Stellaceae bacterium]